MNKSEYMKRYRLEHPEVMQRFLDKNPDYYKKYSEQNKKQYSETMKNFLDKHPNYKLQTIKFKGKPIHLPFNPRKGICSNCGKQGATDLHHLEYHEDDLLKDTIELCDSCHRRQHLKK